MPESVSKTVMEVEALGLQQYATFLEKRIQSTEVALYEPVKLNKLPLFSTRLETIPKDKAQVKALRDDVSLFSTMFVNTFSQRPTDDMEDFFSHENADKPPATTVNGVMRCTTKSDVIKCFVTGDETECPANGPDVEVKIIDATALVFSLLPGTPRTFGEYEETRFMPRVQTEASTVTRLDLIYDE